jgi:polysaccharide deacetylase family protein (PEP-CTERM system associated)
MATVGDHIGETNSPVSAELGIGPRAIKSIFSIDVEDWFHILDVPGTPDLEKWDSLPSLVEKNFHKLLDLFGEKNVRVTCFFLGWVAKKFPQLVREAAARGHEIASHGFAHRLVYAMTPDEFMQDLVLSKQTLESIIGKPVLGYRTSGFSVTEETPWFFDKIVQAGYRYDSSVFPAPRQHGGMKSDKLGPYYITTDSGSLLEFPITVTKVGGRPLCFFGGGYLRLAPYPVIRNMAHKVLRENRPVIFYIHPREVDANHPRLSMSVARRFKSYVNLRTTEQKIRRLVADFPVTTFEEFISQRSNQAENENV